MTRLRRDLDDDAPDWVRESDASSPPKKQCATCGEVFRLWIELTQGEDGQRRCSSCHIGWLKRRMSSPDSRCTEPGCTRSVAEHIAEFRRHGEGIRARITTGGLREATPTAIAAPG